MKLPKKTATLKKASWGRNSAMRFEMDVGIGKKEIAAKTGISGAIANLS